MFSVLVENPGVVVLRNKNGSHWDVFKLQFENDSSSLSADPLLRQVSFAVLAMIRNSSTFKAFATTVNTIRTEKMKRIF